MIDTVEFFPHDILMSHPSTAEFAIQVTKKLTLALQNLVTVAPFINIGQEKLKFIHQLATIFTSIHDPKSKKTSTTTTENENTINAPYASLPRVLTRSPNNKEKKCEQLPRWCTPQAITTKDTSSLMMNHTEILQQLLNKKYPINEYLIKTHQGKRTNHKSFQMIDHTTINYVSRTSIQPR